jgi:plastocyanin
MTRRLAPLGLCAALAVGAVSCSKSDDSADSKATTTTAAKASSGSDTSSSDGTDSKSTDTGSESGSDSGSGSGTAKGDGSKVTLTDGEATAANTVTFNADGTFSPSELSVPAGEKVTFKAAPDAGTHAVRFGSSTDTFTISGGLIETFTISEPGTYTVTEDLTNATMTLKIT